MTFGPERLVGWIQVIWISQLADRKQMLVLALFSIESHKRATGDQIRFPFKFNPRWSMDFEKESQRTLVLQVFGDKEVPLSACLPFVNHSIACHAVKDRKGSNPNGYTKRSVRSSNSIFSF